MPTTRRVDISGRYLWTLWSFLDPKEISLLRWKDVSHLEKLEDSVSMVRSRVGKRIVDLNIRDYDEFMDMLVWCGSEQGMRPHPSTPLVPTIRQSEDPALWFGVPMWSAPFLRGWLEEYSPERFEQLFLFQAWCRAKNMGWQTIHQIMGKSPSPTIDEHPNDAALGWAEDCWLAYMDGRTYLPAPSRLDHQWKTVYKDLEGSEHYKVPWTRMDRLWTSVRLPYDKVGTPGYPSLLGEISRYYAYQITPDLIRNKVMRRVPDAFMPYWFDLWNRWRVRVWANEGILLPYLHDTVDESAEAAEPDPGEWGFDKDQLKTLVDALGYYAVDYLFIHHLTLGDLSVEDNKVCVPDVKLWSNEGWVGDGKPKNQQASRKLIRWVSHAYPDLDMRQFVQGEIPAGFDVKPLVPTSPHNHLPMSAQDVVQMLRDYGFEIKGSLP